MKKPLKFDDGGPASAAASSTPYPWPLRLVVWLCCTLAAVQMVGYVAGGYASGESGIVKYMPDDGFYYLIVSRNFADTGQWSFDRGISETTGFHPLFAYLLAGVRQVASDYFLSALCVYNALVLAAAIMLWRLLSQFRLGIVVLAVMITSYNWKVNTFALMEWPLVVICAASLVGVIASGVGGGRRIAVAFALGFAGSLSRTDFGLLPAVFAAVALFYRASINRFFISTVGAFGAVIGVGCTFIHNAAMSGAWVQGSALIKSHWSSGLPPNPVPALVNLACLFGISPYTVVDGVAAISRTLSVPQVVEHALYLAESSGLLRPSMLAVAATCTAVGFIAYLFFCTAWYLFRKPGQDGYLLWASTLTLAGYVVLYGLVLRCGVFSWYSANMVVPMALLAGIVVSRCRYPLIVGAFGLMLVIMNAVCAPPGRTPYPWHGDFAAAGAYVKQQGKTVAAFNAGVLSYFAHPVRVVNIDGLMNDSVYPYVVRGELWKYLDLLEIRTIVDYNKSLDGSDPVWLNQVGFDMASHGRRCRPTGIEFGRVGVFTWKQEAYDELP